MVWIAYDPLVQCNGHEARDLSVSLPPTFRSVTSREAMFFGFFFSNAEREEAEKRRNPKKPKGRDEDKFGSVVVNE